MYAFKAAFILLFVVCFVNAADYGPLIKAVLKNAPNSAICSLMCLFARGAMYMVDNKSQFKSIPTDYQQCAVIQGDMASIIQCITNTCNANDMRTDVLTGLNEFNTDCTTNNRKNFTRLVSCYETAVPLTTLLGNNTLTPASGVGSGIQGACAEAKQTIQTAKQNCPDLTSQEEDIYGIFTFALFTKYFGVGYQPYHSTCNV